MASLEEELKANTAAVLKLNDTIAKSGLGGASAKVAGATEEKKAGAKAGAKKPTMEEVRTALLKVKEEKGEDKAKEIISKSGGVKKMADIPEAKFTAVIAACTVAMEPGDDSLDDAGGDDDL